MARRLFYGARANHGGSQTRSEPNEEGKHAADLEEDRTASPRPPAARRHGERTWCGEAWGRRRDNVLAPELVGLLLLQHSAEFQTEACRVITSSEQENSVTAIKLR